ncbi:hypothetical protein VTL71DRAFT_14373 [Oculimacula yallundae]|uniref:Uncharacterized protein n=1 Tax=Oculimacula yallundae TaxID=86028 RepID=A0ABR4CKL3_9HELO
MAKQITSLGTFQPRHHDPGPGLSCRELEHGTICLNTAGTIVMWQDDDRPENLRTHTHVVGEIQWPTTAHDKAEQHRRDKAELEQQKREYEKERAAARAKAAREKKAAKANAEKEARKKQGIPEPSRFVRPSQPTISRFVRSDNANKRTWQQMENVAEDSDQTMSDIEQDDKRPPAKRRTIDEGSDDEFGEFPSLSQSDILEKIDSTVLPVKKGLAPVSSQGRRRKASQQLPRMKEADEDSNINSQALDELATTQLLSDLVEAVAKSDHVEAPESSLSQRQNHTPKTLSNSQTSPRRSGRVAEKAGKERVTLSTTRPSTRPVVEIPAMSFENIQLHNMTVNKSRNLEPKIPEVSKGRSFNMPPPSLPKRVNTTAKPISMPRKPITPAWGIRNVATQPLSNAPPSSTQAFLENHLDDFFPSPTQAVRELLDDVDDLPSETQIARELSPERPDKSHIEDMFSTQDFILSPYDLEEIVSPRRTPQKPLGEASLESLNRRQYALCGRQPTPEKVNNDLLDLVSTQDLVLSPNDLADIISQQNPPEETTLSRPKYTHSARQSNPQKLKSDNDDFMRSPNLVFSLKKLEVVISPHCPLEKRTFLESLNCRENTHDSRQPTSERRKDDPDDFMSTQDLVLSPEDLEEICSPARPPAISPDIKVPEVPKHSAHIQLRPLNQEKRRFFQEKEEDLYHATIQESRATSAPRPPKPQSDTFASAGRNQSDSADYGEFDFNLPGLFRDKEDEELEAAIRESKITAELEAKRLAMAGTSDLSRVLSNSTDYGDFDLPGFFEERDEDDLGKVIDTRVQPPEDPGAVTMGTNNGKAKPRRFFEEKYEDQVHAAIHESKALAAKSRPSIEDSEKPRSTKKEKQSTTTDYGNDPFTVRPEVKPRRFFEEKYEDQVHAAIHESKMLAAKPATPKEALEKPKRTMKRILSTATDYGDDDFMGCSQELLELC